LDQAEHEDEYELKERGRLLNASSRDRQTANAAPISSLYETLMLLIPFEIVIACAKILVA
jgi:hypothetical protein